MNPNIAVLTGAREQRGIALESARVVAQELRGRGHSVWLVHLDGDAWSVEVGDRRLPVDRHDLSFNAGADAGPLRFDFVFLAVHDDIGKGPIQGYLDLLGVPYDSSGQLTSLVCDDKVATKTWLGRCGMPLAAGQLYRARSPIPEAELLAHVGLPCFVKPNRGGSAIGSAKVSRADQLGPALVEALRWDDAALVESFVPGREVTCGVVALRGELLTLPLTEYLLDGGCKTWALNQGTVPKQTPAELPEQLTTQVQALAARAYAELGCRGLARIDFRLDEGHDHAPVLLEVNTLPGLERRGAMLTQVVAAGLDLGEVFETIMLDALAEHRGRRG